MKYTSEHQAVCPKTGKEAIHTTEFIKATCTRVPDTLLHFRCSIDGQCKECEEEYRE